jgi:hypothetical protein
MTSMTIVKGIQRDLRVVPTSATALRRPVPVVVQGLIGWLVAAAGVFGIALLGSGPLRGFSPAVQGAVRVVLIVAVGAAFARTARRASPEAIVAVGLAWLVLAIVTDFVTGSRSLAPTYQLLGDPTVSPALLRDLTILVWLASPALFARRGEAARPDDEGEIR